ncbi:MAG: formimidoylglutamate deiminase [Alphaproteobacteria bacterium]|nr:formimidoylglutamate deiminase [Alphaproteobacteria bacterium]
MSRSFHFSDAWLPAGWARDVRVDVADGVIVKVAAGGERAGSERIAGLAVPGMPNLHSHAFQRGMAGLTERRGPANDSFWTWRELMYRFLERITPDDMLAVTAFAYMDMLEAGYTSVAEFHYLHHDIDGRPYGDVAEMASRVAEAADETGIGLTLLPSFYAFGGFGAAAPKGGQRRFINTPDGFAKLVEQARAAITPLPAARIGIAPHSLRAVTPATLRAVVDAAPDGPIHIHAAEQTREVEDCLAWSGRRPVAWLLDEMNMSPRWCVVHATHLTASETERLARSGAVAGLCPITEASLGDGIFDGERYFIAGGRFGIGTDSNIEVDAAAELRQLEYSQRLRDRMRNVLALSEGDSVGQGLFASALAGGRQALGRPIGAIAPGHRADIVVLDEAHPDIRPDQPQHWLDAWIFVTGRRLVKDVMVGGAFVVSDGRHRRHAAIAARYRQALTRITA